MKKICSKCKIEKRLSEFYKDKSTKDGYYSICKLCKYEYQHTNRKIYTENLRKYRKNNKSKILIQSKKYYDKNREKFLEKAQNWRFKNKDKVNQQNRDKDKYRRKFDIDYKIKKNLRSRLYKALKRNSKNSSSIVELGCSIDKFKLWIEMNWADGMNWDNYSFKGWHLDHHIPLSSFNLSIPEEFSKACHFTNIKPMWGKDNLSKGNKIL